MMARAGGGLGHATPAWRSLSVAAPVEAVMVDYLHELRTRLENAGRRKRPRNYRIPDLWQQWDYAGVVRRAGREILIDPYDYLIQCIERVMLPAHPGFGLGGRSLSRIQGVVPASGDKVREGGRSRRGGDWIRTGMIYGMLVRMTTAWDHDGDGRLSSRRWTELGTFLKSILLLPMLRRMGVNVIYLVPIAQHSDLYRKGELGCPYAAKNFLRLEPRLHDRLLGDDPDDVELEFGAFVEAAHRMGMRVMVDLAPRTAARDNDWILDHPDWFYWIDRRFTKRYASPRLPGVTYLNPIASRLHEVYGPQVVREHLAQFRHAPGVTDPRRWAAFADRARRRPPRDLLAAIAREFGVITPPGFSDCINDTQPPWSDVTYLRMYLDHPIAAVEHLDDPKNQPPYVLFDVAKASLFPGRRPNLPLWRALAGILPFYQRFGVDGARVDMAHALPKPLEEMILDRPRRIDPDFCFMAEELGAQNHAKAYRAGYNILIGPSWYMEPRAHHGLVHKFAYQVLRNLRVPALAAAETPDTPRAVTRRGGRRYVRAMAALNSFLPRAVPFINSGLECFERQPMNLGLDSRPRDRFALPRDDPFYGKLAFFDPFVLHWTHLGGPAMVELFAALAAVRQRYLHEMATPANHFVPTVTRQARWVVASGFLVEGGRRALLVLANVDFESERRTTVTRLPPRVRRRLTAEVLLSLSKPHSAPLIRRGRISVSLPPGEVLVLRL
ncbi:MAG: alpha-amylase [Planctomycetota bacterium]